MKVLPEHIPLVRMTYAALVEKDKRLQYTINTPLIADPISFTYKMFFD